MCHVNIYKIAPMLYCFGFYVCIILNIIEGASNVGIYNIDPLLFFWFCMMFLLLPCCNLCFISIYKLVRLLWCFGSYVCITLNVVENDSNVIVIYAIIPWIALFVFLYYATFALLHYCHVFHVSIISLLYCCDFFLCVDHFEPYWRC
jgi:hypothetical protein